MDSQLHFPPNRSEYGRFLHNLYTELNPVRATYDISEAEMQELKADDLYMSFVIDRHKGYSDNALLFQHTRDIAWLSDPDNRELALVVTPNQTAVVELVPDAVRPGIYARTKSIVLRLRQHPKMTQTVAMRMGILPRPAAAGDTDDALVLSGSVVHGQVVLDCPLRGFSGYEVWKDVSGRNEFVLYQVSVGRHFTDTMPLPEGENAAAWSYKVRMLDTSNRPVGGFSNVVSLAVMRGV